MWDQNFVLQILPALLVAFGNTIVITFESFALAAVAAIFVLYLLSANKHVAMATSIVSDFVRKTPILMQLYLLYFVLPGFGVRLSAWTTGVIVLGFHYSFYLAEVYRAALNAVPKGQWEAGRTLGLKPLQIYYKVVIPQVLPLVIPNAGNYLIYMFKDTPYLAAITVVEAMKIASKLGSEYFRYVEPITIVGLLFLLTSWISALLISLLERGSRGKWA